MTKPKGAEPFLAHHRRYDDWLAGHQVASIFQNCWQYARLVPWEGNGLEIGVGTGRFAARLGVSFGIDPAIPT